MNRAFRTRPLAVLLVAVAALTAAAVGAAAVTLARPMSVRIAFSGAYTGNVRWSHAQNGPGTRLVTYGCMQWKIPGSGFGMRIFGDAGYEPKQSLLLKFDYEPRRLGRAQRLRSDQLAGVVVVPPDRHEYATLGAPRASVTITLAPNLLGGSFAIRNLQRLSSSGRRLHIRGTWKCASVIRRTH
jgi:hypothetical protein